MIIVPIQGDRIETKDGNNFVVSSYTNLKSEPAVYIEVNTPNDNSVVYFSDIIMINDVDVDYNSTNKTFTANGTFRRKISLPQPGDTIITKGSSEPTEVKAIKLHNQKEGVTKGLIICDEYACHELTSIEDVQHKDGGEKFNGNTFIKQYKDYLPFNF